jgi:hypothetical protein
VSILIVRILGGKKGPIGAIVHFLLEIFASQLFSRERFNLLIGSTFLLVLYFSPNGLLGFMQGRKNTKEKNMRNIANGRGRLRRFIPIASLTMSGLARDASYAGQTVKIDLISPLKGAFGRLGNVVV